MARVFDWGIVLDVGVGVGVLLMGIGICYAMVALARTFQRLNHTLDAVDAQIEALGTPVSAALGHVTGIADTADRTVAKLSGVVQSLEDVAASIGQTAKLMRDAISPALINVGATLGGITAGLRRLVRGSSDA